MDIAVNSILPINNPNEVSVTGTPLAKSNSSAAKWKGEQIPTTREARAVAPENRTAAKGRPNRPSVLPRASVQRVLVLCMAAATRLL